MSFEHPVVTRLRLKRAEDVQLKIADAITAFAGSMPFVYVHAVLFAVWMLAVESNPWPKLTLIVSLDYGVDDGRQQVVTYPSAGFGRFGYGGFGYRPYWSRFGGYGRFRSPFYYGWDDPFWWRGYGEDIDVYTVYTSYLDMDIKRAGDGESVFEGTARARSRSDDLGLLVPNLVEAMFTGFPGNSGETVKITVAPERRR